MDRVDQLLAELRTFESGGAPVLTVTVDLTPGADGSTLAGTVIKQGWRRVEADFPGLEHDALRSYQEDQQAVEALIDEAAAQGAYGLFYFGCAALEMRVELETPVPPRNSVNLGQRPSLIELARYRYLLHRHAVVATVTQHSIRAVRIGYGELDEAAASEHWKGAVSGPHGGTDTQGVGSPGTIGSGGAGSAGGWHGKTRIEKSILAHQEAFAREDASRLLELIEEGDVVLVAGPDEARVELLRQLPPGVSEAVIEAPSIDPTRSETEIAEMATALVTERQYARAANDVQRWRSGDLAARAIAGAEGISGAVERGQLETLILFEDAIPHLGTASDAREHAGVLAPEVADELIRGALEVSADCVIADGEVPAGTDGVMGILRWA